MAVRKQDGDNRVVAMHIRGSAGRVSLLQYRRKTNCGHTRHGPAGPLISRLVTENCFLASFIPLSVVADYDRHFPRVLH